MGELGGGGNCPNMFKGFEGVNDSRINERDVYFDDFDGINGFNVPKFCYKGRMVL